jgi:hypothetical protein
MEMSHVESFDIVEILVAAILARLARQVTHHSAALSPKNARHKYFVTEANVDVGSVIREFGHRGGHESG